ncbi:MAG: hypothetical protein P8H13_03775 [Polaribacter sp.]|nr:hypothetical protein [Polaribacter sp.]MDG1811042.1 hypothetical protein [Polaribacter sp.]MDG1993039.1 hypothetical protein [Polaribacter sp.]
MRKLINLNSYFFVFGIPLTMIFLLILLSKSSVFQQNPSKLSLAITLDLLLIVPFVYFLLIRKTAIPKITIVTSFIVGMIISSIILPTEEQEVLSLIKTIAIPVIELTILYFVVTKSHKIIKNYKLENNQNIDFFDAMSLAVLQVAPAKVASVLTTEIAVVYYCFISWKKRALLENEFTYHDKSTSVSVILGFILVILIETFTAHHLLSKWNVIVAWVFTFLSVYTCLQMIALLKSLSKRPIFIDEQNQQIILRYGIFSEAFIPFSEIKDICVFDKDISEDETVTVFSPLGKLEGVNMLIETRKELIFNRFYGFKKKYTSLVFFVDQKRQFVNKIKDKI